MSVVIDPSSTLDEDRDVILIAGRRSSTWMLVAQNAELLISPIEVNPADAPENTIEQAQGALELIDQANKMLGVGLHRCQNWELVKDSYFEAGGILAAAGLHEEAVTAFLQSAAVCRVLGTELEYRNLVGFAIDSCHRSDPLRAVELLSQHSESMERHQLPLLAGKCERDAAEVLEKNGFLEAALQHYERARSLFSNDFRAEQDRLGCDARIRYLMCSLGRYTEVAMMFQEYGERKTSVNLSSTNSYMLTVLSVLAAASGDNFACGVPRAHRKFLELQDEDTNFRKGKEFELLKNLFIGFDKSSLHIIDTAIAKYRSCSVQENTPIFDILIAKCRDNLYQVLKPYFDEYEEIDQRNAQ